MNSSNQDEWEDAKRHVLSEQADEMHVPKMNGVPKLWVRNWDDRANQWFPLVAEA